MTRAIVHMAVTRSPWQPGIARWYVRAVWRDRLVTCDRVLESGELPVPETGATSRQMAVLALEAALAALRAEDAPEG